MKRRITITGQGITAQVADHGLLRFGASKAGKTTGLVVEGDFEYEVEDLEKYVNVRLLDTSGNTRALSPAQLNRTWTYRDPFGVVGGLVVGDVVWVPFGYSDELHLAEVVSRGRNYTGPCTDVYSRVHKPSGAEPW